MADFTGPQRCPSNSNKNLPLLGRVVTVLRERRPAEPGRPFGVMHLKQLHLHVHCRANGIIKDPH